MKIAVTGSTGQVGKHTAQKCLDQGHTIVCIDVVEPDDTSSSSDDGRSTFIKADLTDYDTTLRVLTGCDAVIHSAAWPKAGGKPDAWIHNTNTSMSYNVLRACAELGIKRVTQLSSINAIGAVYTPYRRPYRYFPLDEKSPYEPADPYSLSKMICELQAESIVRTFPEMRIASIRPHACLVTKPAPGVVDPDAAKFGRVLDYYDEYNINDCWAWSLMDAVARACLLGLTSEGWTGAEAFYIVAPTTKMHEEKGDAEPSTLENLKKYHPQAKIKPGWYEEHRGRGLFDCSKAERMLGWKHDL